MKYTKEFFTSNSDEMWSPSFFVVLLFVFILELIAKLFDFAPTDEY